jgi:hypothetical protein
MARREFSDPLAQGFGGFGAQRVLGQLVVHAEGEFGDVGEADVQGVQQRIILRREEARRQADRVQRLPELVLAMGIIGPCQRRFAASRRAAEDQLQARTQLLRQDVFLRHQCD